MKLMEIQELPDTLRGDTGVMLNMTESITNETTTEDLLTLIRGVTKRLRICTLKKSMSKIANQGRYFSFLRIISNEDLNIESTTWVHPFRDVVGHFNESEKWYKFLGDLYSKFSGYEIQRERHKYNVAEIDNWGQESMSTPGIQVTRNTFETFLNKIASYNVTAHEDIRNISVTELQLEELNHVLSVTLKHRIDVECSEPYVFIRGDYVSLEEVVQSASLGYLDEECRDFFSFKKI
ncbi:uncharacterized protein CEXT_422371 [Caerostris extrusa]|uniref:Uncharacterized protein n=1 Tax=Caerostris extrusa TaxID=172846 RepID=A0AAV4U2F2_CAEEX|nr:uncharacterized protein CEXT_422371 [Caerostris extrusa]